MNARMRMLLLLVKACQEEGRIATAFTLRRMGAFSEITILEDLQKMEELGMVELHKSFRRTITGGCTQTEAVLTSTGEERLPAVRRVREMDEAVTD